MPPPSRIVSLEIATPRSSPLHSPGPAARWRKRRGFTLLEVLIATAVTLLMMVSLAQIFKVIGDSMRQGRAALELNNRLRSVVLRIRDDLEHATAIVDPPTDAQSGTGYLKYFDGSLTDFSAVSQAAGLSRFGDVDDILMFTARAGDVWFTGKVPRFVLTKTVPDLTNDANGNGIVDDFEMVTISSQHAEIVAFVQPLVSNAANPGRDPGFLVANPSYYEDTDDFPGIPDGYRLYYRTLLIRPDLNSDADGYLPANDPIFVAQPSSVELPDGSTQALPTPLGDMAPSHALCDLSIRRVTQGANSRIAANSLEDLVNPANRFAHVQVPIPGTSTPDFTMPLLALDQVRSELYDQLRPPSGSVGVGSGLLHPAFMLHASQIFFPGISGLPPSRVGEDVLASDILAFDVKGYDPGVPLLASVGPDGGPGIATDGDPSTSILGWAGSDDLVLSPNDPGYVTVLGSQPIGAGEYVDLCWARKTLVHAGLASPPAGANLWSPLSGFSQTNAPTGYRFTDALYKSGLVIQNPRDLLVFQPAYDTWTTSHEGDGIRQAERGRQRGVIQIADANANLVRDWQVVNGVLNELTWRVGIIDAGTDGLDNFNSATGVDDPLELETSPPFPIALRGLTISIRMEDPATRTVKQMSVAREFVTQ